MKIFCTVVLALAVAITLKRGKAKFLLVEADDAPEKDASGQDELENLPTEQFPIRYLLNKIKKLEEKVEAKDVETKKIIDEKDYEIKKMIEERDETANLLASQVKNHSAQLENFQGQSHMELVFIATAFKTKRVPVGEIKFDSKIIDPLNSFNDVEGLFQVPSSGNYLFFFDSFVSVNLKHTSNYYSQVSVYVNGNLKYLFPETVSDPSKEFYEYAFYQHSFMFTSKLNQTDSLYLKNIVSKTLVTGFTSHDIHWI